ncbi:lysophospholipid acyltransferase family protein [Candidatus Bandiella euplotis]|uniref:lysophospholipid acyltransferase family protein n=1 Tax=Candidatus Bandiella euplotis TaxID=1664265 RepID=UPI002B25F2C4|nr:DUF374 domain-containing protein [Candidatus Bandiella woodruffii]
MLFLTSKIQVEIDDGAKAVLESQKTCFVALWHGRILIFPKIMQEYGFFKVLTSIHNDGKYIDKFINLYGHKTIRGSTYKGGMSATKQIVKDISNNKRIVIIPDGPRGPRYKVNSAITNIAAKFNIPIIHVSFSSTKVKILNTWDKFMIPLPFSKIFVNISLPVYFKERNEQKLENLMLEQMQALDSICEIQV